MLSAAFEESLTQASRTLHLPYRTPSRWGSKMGLPRTILPGKLHMLRTHTCCPSETTLFGQHLQAWVTLSRQHMQAWVNLCRPHLVRGDQHSSNAMQLGHLLACRTPAQLAPEGQQPLARGVGGEPVAGQLCNAALC